MSVLYGLCGLSVMKVSTSQFHCFWFWLQAAGSDGIRLTMESALTARDRVGVQDFVLLENFTSEAAFIENLRKRFKENLIYVSSRAAATALIFD